MSIEITKRIRQEENSLFLDLEITEESIDKAAKDIEEELFKRIAAKKGYVPERTCTIRKRDENNGECSNCGFVAGIYDGYDPFEETYTGNHCINCGAKVVSE